MSADAIKYEHVSPLNLFSANKPEPKVSIANNPQITNLEENNEDIFLTVRNIILSTLERINAAETVAEMILYVISLQEIVEIFVMRADDKKLFLDSIYQLYELKVALLTPQDQEAVEQSRRILQDTFLVALNIIPLDRTIIGMTRKSIMMAHNIYSEIQAYHYPPGYSLLDVGIAYIKKQISALKQNIKQYRYELKSFVAVAIPTLILLNILFPPLIVVEKFLCIAGLIYSIAKVLNHVRRVYNYRCQESTKIIRIKSRIYEHESELNKCIKKMKNLCARAVKKSRADEDIVSNPANFRCKP